MGSYDRSSSPEQRREGRNDRKDKSSYTAGWGGDGPTKSVEDPFMESRRRKREEIQVCTPNRNMWEKVEKESIARDACAQDTNRYRVKKRRNICFEYLFPK